MRFLWLLALFVAPIYSRDVVSKVYFHLTISCEHLFRNSFPFNVRLYRTHEVWSENAISERYMGGRIPAGGKVSGIYEGTVSGPEGSEYTTSINIQHRCRLDQIPNNDKIYLTGTCKIKPWAPCHIYHFIELRDRNWEIEETPRIEQQ